MTNLTSRLAIKIRYLPDFDFSWSDSTPQQPRSSLTIDDFLPNELDAAILKERSVCYLMRFLVETFPNLKHLAAVIPPMEPLHPVVKSEVVPKSATIEILSKLLVDACLSGNQQVNIKLGPMATVMELCII